MWTKFDQHSCEFDLQQCELDLKLYIWSTVMYEFGLQSWELDLKLWIWWTKHINVIYSHVSLITIHVNLF